jgi:hypothetical protein
MFRGVLTLPQIDRVRWILFPEVRISPQLGGSSAALATKKSFPTLCA